MLEGSLGGLLGCAFLCPVRTAHAGGLVQSRCANFTGAAAPASADTERISTAKAAEKRSKGKPAEGS